MRFTEFVLETYTFGVKGGSLQFIPHHQPRPTPFISPSMTAPAPVASHPLSHPPPPPPPTAALTSCPFNRASLTKPWLATDEAKRWLFESHSPDVSCLCLRFFGWPCFPLTCLTFRPQRDEQVTLGVRCILLKPFLLIDSQVCNLPKQFCRHKFIV